MPDTRPSVRAVASKTVNRLRTRGAGEVLALALRRVVEAVWSTDVLVFFTRRAGDETVSSDALVFRQATHEDAATYARDIGTDSPTTFHDRLSERTRCFVVERDRKFLHASWVTTAAAWTRELRRYLVPPPGDAYIYESFTRSDARGLGIYPFALRNISAHIRAEGTTSVWVAAEEDNIASFKAISKAGFGPAFSLPYGRRFGVLTVGSAWGPDAEIAARFLSEVPDKRGL